MEKKYVSWNDLPDTLSKEQFYKICHISKKTASDLLNSGKVPCIKSDKRTHKFKIRKADAIEYLKHKEELTAYSSANYTEIKKADLIKFYTKLLRACPDVITPSDIHDITGFRKETVHRWCQKGKLKSFKSHNRLQIPKRYFISFLVSPEFSKIADANQWYKMVMIQFYIETRRSRRNP